MATRTSPLVLGSLVGEPAQPSMLFPTLRRRLKQAREPVSLERNDDLLTSSMSGLKQYGLPLFTCKSVDDFARQADNVGLPKDCIGTYLFVSDELPPVPGKHDSIAYVGKGDLRRRLIRYGVHFIEQKEGRPHYDDFLVFAHLKPLIEQHYTAGSRYAKIALLLDADGHKRALHNKPNKLWRSEQVKRIHKDDDGHRDLVHREMFRCLTAGMTFQVYACVSDDSAALYEEGHIIRTCHPRWNKD
jgi:hypothetical protein